MRNVASTANQSDAGRIHALLASSNLGAPLDACLAEFDQKRFPLLKTVVQAIVVYAFRAYARLAQYEQFGLKRVVTLCGRHSNEPFALC